MLCHFFNTVRHECDVRYFYLLTADDVAQPLYIHAACIADVMLQP
jgi:hypothetical protein